LAITICIGALCTAIFTACLIYAAYTRCPFWDEWKVLEHLAEGHGVLPLSWLWSPHNEHRLVVPRLLVAADVYWFGARNVSLFLLIFLVQLLHWASLIYIVERWAACSRSAKLTIEGLWGFLLFCPTQVENFTWSFQAGFLLAFLAGTIGLASIAFVRQIGRPHLSAGLALLALIVAATNLAGGLVLYAALLLMALAVYRSSKIKHSDAGAAFPWGWKQALMWAVAGLAFLVIYFVDYHRMPVRNASVTTSAYLIHFLRYVLTYFGTSIWSLLPHQARAISLCAIGAAIAFVLRVVRKPGKVTTFEIFLAGECVWILLMCFATAFGRTQLGVLQAASSRYQTSAVIFWASLVSIGLLQLDRTRNQKWKTAYQWGIVLILLLSCRSAPSTYRSAVARAKKQNTACDAVMRTNGDTPLRSVLSPEERAVHEGTRFLKETGRW
jgi:hypothetical protein